MYIRCLVDWNNEGTFFVFTIQTDDAEKTLRELKKYSRDVRYIESKDTASSKDKGQRHLKDGSIIVRCTYFGEKIGAAFAFANNQYRMSTINKAVVV